MLHDAKKTPLMVAQEKLNALSTEVATLVRELDRTQARLDALSPLRGEFQDIVDALKASEGGQ